MHGIDGAPRPLEEFPVRLESHEASQILSQTNVEIGSANRPEPALLTESIICRVKSYDPVSDGVEYADSCSFWVDRRHKVQGLEPANLADKREATLLEKIELFVAANSADPEHPVTQHMRWYVNTVLKPEMIKGLRLLQEAGIETSDLQ